MTKETFYRERLEWLRKKTIEELVECFNREVGCMGWTTTRSLHLIALRTAIEEKKFNLDQSVFMPKATSYKRRIKVVDGALVPIE